MELKNTKSNKTYVSLLTSDGTLRIRANEGEEGAFRRDYELKDGTKGSKWEKIYSEISGVIKNIDFKESVYGESLQLHIDQDTILTIPANSNFEADILKKLPNVDLSKKITIKSYSFTDKKDGKLKKGVVMVQDEKKITDFFYDFEKKKNLNGLPEVEKGKIYDKNDWKIYFMQVRKFLKEYVINNVVSKLMIDGMTAEQIFSGVEEDIEKINF